MLLITLWYLEVTVILSVNCNIKCQLRKTTEIGFEEKITLSRRIHEVRYI